MRMKKTVQFFAICIGLQGQTTNHPVLACVKDRQKEGNVKKPIKHTKFRVC